MWYQKYEQMFHFTRLQRYKSHKNAFFMILKFLMCLKSLHMQKHLIYLVDRKSVLLNWQKESGRKTNMKWFVSQVDFTGMKCHNTGQKQNSFTWLVKLTAGWNRFIIFVGRSWIWKRSGFPSLGYFETDLCHLSSPWTLKIRKKGTFLDHFIYQKPALISPTAHAGFRKGIRPYTKYIVGYELYLDENTTFDDQEQWPAMAARYVI